MDLKTLSTREVGLFSHKVYLGRFFAEKTREDFKTDKEFEAYLEKEDREVYCLLREPRTDETNTLRGEKLPEELFKKLSPEQALKWYEDHKEDETKRDERLMKVLRSCIVGSNILDDGKPADIEVVRDLFMQNTGVSTKLAEDWMGSSVNFKKANVEK